MVNGRHGVPQWGNCCIRQYNTQHCTPYAAVDANITKLNFSGSVRYDRVRVDGTIAGTQHKGGLMLIAIVVSDQ
jgi:hypothetical protein